MYALPFLLALCSAAVQEQESDPFRSRRAPVREELLRRGGGGAETEASVRGALGWLSRHQSADGSWKPTGYIERCLKDQPCKPNTGEEEGDGGVTALALVAFLGAGHSPLSEEFGEPVKRGLRWLLNRQDPEGCLEARATLKYMYPHAIATLALAEAYGLTRSVNLKEPAQKAVDFLVAAQNPGKGWRYHLKSGDNDTSVTGWCVMALRAAELAGLTFPRASFDGALAWLDEVTNPETGHAGYTHRGSYRGIPRFNEQFDWHETPTAMAVHTRILIERRKSDPRLAKGVDLLLKDLPKREEFAIDYYHWFQTSQAIFQLVGGDGEKWKSWNAALKEALLKHQRAGDGCTRGSWEPVDRWSYEGGRVYATAINALTLETYYRGAQLFGDK